MAQTTELGASSHDAAELSRQDLNFLGMLAAPEEFTYSFPPFYITLFSLLTSFAKKLERYAIGIPRGFAKTTFVKLLCLWYVLFSHKQFILIVGASEDLAVNTLSDICDLLGSPNIRKLFGNWQAEIEVDTQALKVFYFRGRNIILRAIGAGTAVRGINRKNKRPDVIIMDDVQKRETSENKDLSDQLLKWILGTLMKARSNDGCTYIYVGNMYPQNCILEKLKHNTQWTSFIVGGILADGTSLWEELRPIEELISEYQSDSELGHADIFISEILNSTDIAAASGIDISRIPLLPSYYHDADSEGSFIIIDPSAGKKTSDDCTISHYSVCDGKPIFDDLLHGTFSPLETIQAALKLALERGTRLIAVEGVAYQSTLLYWFEFYCEKEGISGFEFVELSPKGQAKNNRIKRGLLRLISGEIYLHPNVRSKVLSQIMDWNPLKISNVDDIIDPIGYVEELMREYPHLIVKTIFDVDSENVSATHADTLALPY
ncbi:MAG: hypothetical protein ACO22U_13910 [bacterium]